MSSVCHTTSRLGDNSMRSLTLSSVVARNITASTYTTPTVLLGRTHRLVESSTDTRSRVHLEKKKKSLRLLQDLNLRGNLPIHFECITLTTRSNSRRGNAYRAGAKMRDRNLTSVSLAKFKFLKSFFKHLHSKSL